MSFVSGFSGTYIHNKNAESEAGQTQTNQPATPQPPGQGQQGVGGGQGAASQPTSKQKGEAVIYNPLIGGAAGLIVLTSFEALSVLFSNGQMVLNAYNVILLIGTCLAAGFAPMEVIDNATAKLRGEKTKAGQDRDTYRKEYEDYDKLLASTRGEMENIKRALGIE